MIHNFCNRPLQGIRNTVISKRHERKCLDFNLYSDGRTLWFCSIVLGTRSNFYFSKSKYIKKSNKLSSKKKSKSPLVKFIPKHMLRKLAKLFTTEFEVDSVERRVIIIIWAQGWAYDFVVSIFELPNFSWKTKEKI